MTSYCVQISRWYELEADGEEDAVELALEKDLLQRTRPVISVTDLDEASRIGTGQPGRES